MPALDDILESRCRSDSYLAAMRLVVALRRDLRQEGKLPDQDEANAARPESHDESDDIVFEVQ